MLCRYIYNIYRVPASRRAVLAGFVTAVVGTTWVAGGAQLYRGQLRHVSVSSPPQPSSTQLCPASWNVTAASEDTAADSAAAPAPGYLGLYEVSYVWYSAIGVWLTVLTALLASLVWPEDVTRLDKRLLSPALEAAIEVTAVQRAWLR